MKHLASAALAATLVVGAALAGGATPAGAASYLPILSECTAQIGPMPSSPSEEHVYVQASSAPQTVSPGQQATFTLRLDHTRTMAGLSDPPARVEVTWDLPPDAASVDQVTFSSQAGWSSEVVELVDGPGGHLTVRHTSSPGASAGVAHSPATTIAFTVAPTLVSHSLEWPPFTSVSAAATGLPLTEVCTPAFPDHLLYTGTTVVTNPVPSFSDVPPWHTFFEPIESLARAGVAEGQPDGTFRPLGVVTRQAMAAFAFRLAGEPAFDLPDQPTFPDVPPTNPFSEAVEWLVAEGIATGYPDGSYRPLEPITRQHMAAYLHRMAGSPPFEVGLAPRFPDVPASNPFRAQIEWLDDRGITTGYPDGTFRPQGTTTRQVMAAFLFRFDELVLDAPSTGSGS